MTQRDWSLETKRCTTCQRDLPLRAFARVRSDRPWLRSKCRACVAEADPRRAGSGRRSAA